MDTKLIYAVNLPNHVIDKCNIDEDSVFIARYDDGQILIESLTAPEREEWYDADFDDELEDSYDEGFTEGAYEGFEDGYEQGYHDAMHGEKYDPSYARFDEDHRGSNYCHCCIGTDEIIEYHEQKSMTETTLRDFLDSLSAAEKRAALVYLSVKYAEDQRGTEDAD